MQIIFRPTCIWVMSQNCVCLVTWFCYQLIAKPGNNTATISWSDPYGHHNIYANQLKDIYFHVIFTCIKTKTVDDRTEREYTTIESVNHHNNSLINPFDTIMWLDFSIKSFFRKPWKQFLWHVLGYRLCIRYTWHMSHLIVVLISFPHQEEL